MFGKNVTSYNKENIVDTNLEKIDPTPNIHDLFRQFNIRFFWDRLNMVEVSWSTGKMTSCAGVCTFRPRTRHCQIRLSAPLLSLRSRKDLVETLLHEMIHAFLFMTNNNRDRDDHGPEFHKHMHRINKEAGTNITVYHTFHDEVRSFQNHVWRCNGPCQKSKPFYGLVRRANNRAPGPYDRWWDAHRMTCSGTFVKIKEPAGYQDKKLKKNQPKKTINPNVFTFIDSRGSSTPKSKVPENVNNTVREIWAKKYPNTGKRKSDHNPQSNKKLIIQCPDCDEMLPDDEMTRHKDNCTEKENPCPACGVLVKKSSLEEHLNTCLEDSINEDFFTLSGGTSQDELVACTICGKDVDRKTVDAHVDECLKSSCPICRTPVEQGHLEEHLNVCLEGSMTEEDFSTSDEKLPGRSEASSKNAGINIGNLCIACGTPIKIGRLKEHLSVCGTEFRDLHTEKRKTVACPICGTHVLENTINSHIDECLNMQAFREEFSF